MEPSSMAVHLDISDPLRVVGAVLLTACAMVVLYRMTHTGSQYPCPPGPKGEPFIGCLRKTPTFFPAKFYKEVWGKEYGDLIFFKVLGAPILVINNASLATELLDKRGSNNGDRPIFHYAMIMGFKHTISFMQWGKRFQAHRKMLQRFLSKAAIQQYAPVQEREARLLAKRFVESQKNISLNIRRAATSIVLNAAFGQTITRDDDPFIEIAVKASEGLDGVGGFGGVTILDWAPWLKYMPNWCASAPLKSARKHTTSCRNIHQVPCKRVQEQMAVGSAQPSLLHDLLQMIADEPESNLKVEDAQGAAVTMYSAGQDTTTNTIISALTNLLLNPEIQKKAQEEIDAVTGRQRLPEMKDRDSLPYLDSIITETLRWFPATPLGLPHKSLQDDILQGYFIPKGTVIFGNAYAMTHDESVYKNPDSFDPDRYARGEPLPIGQWGFGRRVCVGQHLATSTIFIILATAIATLNFGPEIDSSTGKKKDCVLVMEEGFRGRVDAVGTFKNSQVTYRYPEAERLLDQGSM